MADIPSFAVRMVSLADLIPHPRNYRSHPADQIEHLAQSLKEHQFYRNVVAARGNVILAGHGVVEAAKSLGMTHVPVLPLDVDPLDPRALKVLASDNTVSHLAEDDDRALSELLKEVSELDITGLLGTGYDQAMLATLAMVTRHAGEIANLDEAAQWAGMPEYTQEAEALELRVRFRTEDDRAEFARRLDVALSEHMKTIWWPAQGRDDVGSLRIAG